MLKKCIAQGKLYSDHYQVIRKSFSSLHPAQVNSSIGSTQPVCCNRDLQMFPSGRDKTSYPFAHKRNWNCYLIPKDKCYVVIFFRATEAIRCSKRPIVLFHSSERGDQAWNKWPEGSPSVYALQIAGHTLSGLSNYTKTKTLTHPPLSRVFRSQLSFALCPPLSWFVLLQAVTTTYPLCYTMNFLLVLFLSSPVKPYFRCDSHWPLT